MINKYVKNGNVAILYSPYNGAGWSSWGAAEYQERMIFDPELVQAVLKGANIEELTKIAEQNYPGQYLGGLKDLTVTWLSEGTRFLIEESWGEEYVQTKDDLIYIA